MIQLKEIWELASSVIKWGSLLIGGVCLLATSAAIGQFPEDINSGEGVALYFLSAGFVMIELPTAGGKHRYIRIPRASVEVECGGGRRSSSIRVRDCTQIQMIREHDIVALRGIRHDLVAECVRAADA